MPARQTRICEATHRFQTSSDHRLSLGLANFTCITSSALDDRPSTMRFNPLRLYCPSIPIREHHAFTRHQYSIRMDYSSYIFDRRPPIFQSTASSFYTHSEPPALAVRGPSQVDSCIAYCLEPVEVLLSTTAYQRSALNNHTQRTLPRARQTTSFPTRTNAGLRRYSRLHPATPMPSYLLKTRSMQSLDV
ncbi:hypothetical protein HGRIS_013984 [Hohenbuehelia grisea]|uniref:Uncharacterized protein n=1 Tax=Hohenbuehelia grisea TaxID=104357 RepID=A0ABR3JS67_9AGAR